MPGLGLVCALEAEGSILSSANRHGKLVLGCPHHTNEGLVVYISGMGHEMAFKASLELAESGVAGLISWGCAGALSPTLNPGDIVLPQHIIFPEKNKNFSADDKLYQTFLSHLQEKTRVHTGQLLQHPKVVTTPGEKKALFHTYNAVAVDMESAAIAEAAQIAHIPFVAIRTISDTAGMIMPESLTYLTDIYGRIRPYSLIRYILKNPLDIFYLFKLGSTFKAAGRTLKRMVPTIHHISSNMTRT